MPDRRSFGLSGPTRIPPARLQQPGSENEVSSLAGSPCRLGRFQPIDVTGVMSQMAVSGPVSGKPTYGPLRFRAHRGTIIRVASEEVSQSPESRGNAANPARFSRFVQRADRFFCAVHAVIWCIVMVVWSVAWQRVHAPIHPEFNTAKDFLGAVDILVYLNVDELSFRLATLPTSWLHWQGDWGLAYVVIFAALMLLAGSLQWFLIGRLTRWTCSEYGPRLAKYLVAGITIWIAYSAFVWVAWWWL